MELKGGYILQGIRDFLFQNHNSFLEDHLQSLSTFQLETTHYLEPIVNDSLLAVFQNIISRGLPTLSSTFIEESFCNLIHWAVKSNDDTVGDLFYKIKEDLPDRNEKLKQLKRALFIIDPRLNRNNIQRLILPTENKPDNKVEESFMYNVLPNLIGGHSIQLLQPQRSIQSILKTSKRTKEILDNNLGAFHNDFYAQRVDFSIEFPPIEGYNKGLVVEIDGPQHNIPPQNMLDTHRDDACNQVNWRSLRILTNEINSIPQTKQQIISSYFKHPYSERCRENYENPLYNSISGRQALQLALSPFGIARIQLTLLQLLLSGKLLLDKPWNITVIERDVPCANIAIKDFKLWMQHLFALEGLGRSLPQINLFVFNTAEFANCELNFDNKNVILYSDNPTNYSADLIIDVSVLQRTGLTSLPFSFINQCSTINPLVISIRSSHSISEYFKLKCSENINYQSVFLTPNNGTHEINEGVHSALTFLLQSIFRKEVFREGQLEIIDKAIKRDNVIGLLPTGSGKSLCYQLTCLLQPSATLVIDPLVSLMKDQTYNLSAAGFDHIKKINSELNTLEMIDALDELKNGRYQFVFISPERFQIQKFRDALEEIRDDGFYKIKQSVIDEAHCVSEWGFDFRPAYLRLGDLVRQFCGDDVLIFGLTGTASFDVLSDVAREIKINEQGLVEANSFNRDELKFMILPDRVDYDQANSTKKINKLKEVLQTIPAFFGYNNPAEFYNRVNGKFINSGIIFCPHKGITNNTNSPFSVGTVANHSNDFLNGDLNVGGMGLNTVVDKYSGALDNRTRDIVQDKFKNNETCILVSTNAFGMGIDKPNIRFIIHFSCPQSIEAYYQEAGRAGRDRGKALCVSIFSDDKHFFKINDEVQMIAAPFNPQTVLDSYQYTEYLKAETAGSEALMYAPPVVDFNYDYQNQPIDMSVYFNSTNYYLSQKNHINQINNIPQPPFAQNNDAQRRIYFQNLNFPGYDKERLIFGGVLQFINPALVRGVLSVTIPFFINHTGPNGTLNLDDRPNSANHNGYVERGIYRLVILGIIKDYTKDYNAQFYNVELNNLSNEKIIERVKSYVSNYKSQAFVDQVENKIRSIVLPNGSDNILYKSIYYLIDFIYNEIERKRRNALREFIRVLRLGSENIHKFREEIDTYFNSKYLPLLRDFTTEYSIETLWELINEIDNNLDLIRHLYGASTRLLVEHDDNLLFQLLRSYASFIHPGFDKNQAIEYFKAFEKAEGNPVLINPNRSEISEWIIRFYNEVITRQPLAAPGVSTGITNFHLTWLHKFNNTFIGNTNG